MKSFHFALFSLALLFIVTSSTIQQKETPRLFEKTVWLEVDIENDSVLFRPYSKAWEEMWFFSDRNIFFESTPVMNYEKYKFSFNNRKDNLYTILHPKIIDGSLQLYSPYDPQTFGLGSPDDGEMRFPLKGTNANETFLTSDSLRNVLAYYLGRFGPQPDIPLIDEYGEPLIETDSVSGIQMYIYPHRDFMWYDDQSIIKYKLRVRISYNKKGIEKKRTIESIAPIVHQFSHGQFEGEKELFWLDFNELTPILKDAYYFDATGKPVSYLKHFERKVLNTAI